MPDAVLIAELVLAVVVLAVAVPVVLLVVRRRWLSQHGWVVDCSVRRTTTPSSNWTLGVARLNGDDVEWYRVFSWSLRPPMAMRRGETQIVSTRDATPAERPLLADQHRIAELRSPAGSIEVAMAPGSMTAFLSWLEAAPPGHGYRH